ncbi:MAG: hypothetical protein AUG16_03150 [Thaumarchaeota archaeon 13_1_20CM_2_39_20]|nr:MAG: hypothetical protein AUG16_03150 [Thaumarchaeota archaeon 13_1_20CM_2_39_20]
MIFITLIKFRKKASDVIEVGKKIMQNLPPDVKVIGTYWTLGRYDSVWIFEGKDPKDAIKLWLPGGEVVRTETLVSLPRDEAIRLL